MNQAIIVGSGLFTPSSCVSNQALVQSFNAYIDTCVPFDDADACYSDHAFIEKASGIKQRYFMDAEGVLDSSRMRPSFMARNDEEVSIQASMAISAAKIALDNAQVSSEDVDLIIVACSNMQRAYPAISIEVQKELRAGGYAFDMNVACSSATFALQQGRDAILSGSARTVLLINPEICSAHLNFCDRDSHFIFGDACTAIVLQASEIAKNKKFEILSCKLATKFSNNIRNNAGFLNRCEEGYPEEETFLFKQQGRKVFKEVCPMVGDHLLQHLQSEGLDPSGLKRLWLHQANQSMNDLIARRVLGRDVDLQESPVILDRYANTSSAGSIICFHLYHDDFQPGDLGVICSFGAGYSVGSIIIRAL